MADIGCTVATAGDAACAHRIDMCATNDAAAHHHQQSGKYYFIDRICYRFIIVRCARAAEHDIDSGAADGARILAVAAGIYTSLRCITLDPSYITDIDHITLLRCLTTVIVVTPHFSRPGKCYRRPC